MEESAREKLDTLSRLVESRRSSSVNLSIADMSLTDTESEGAVGGVQNIKCPESVELVRMGPSVVHSTPLNREKAINPANRYVEDKLSQILQFESGESHELKKQEVESRNLFSKRIDHLVLQENMLDREIKRLVEEI